MKDTVKDIVYITAVFIVVLVMIAIPAVIIARIITTQTCAEMAQLHPEYQFKMVRWSGCLIQSSSGLWISIDDMHLVTAEFDSE